MSGSFVSLSIVLFLVAAPGLAIPEEEGKTLEIGAFSRAPKMDALPRGWEPLGFRRIERETVYDLVEVDGRRALRADSDASASGLIRRVDVDLRRHPVLEWHWKIEHVIPESDVRKKAGDDYPARVYVAFGYEPERVGLWERARFEAARLFFGDYPPTRAINYIWATRAAEGEIVPNAYSDRVRMIVVESGPERVGEWVHEEQDVYEDYLRAYGEPPPHVTGVAVMTDSDDTGSTALAWYGDLRFRAADRPGRAPTEP